jgi:hypothetical protein
MTEDNGKHGESVTVEAVVSADQKTAALTFESEGQTWKMTIDAPSI